MKLRLMIPSIVGTLYLVAIARGAGEVAEQALKDGLGHDYLKRIDPDLAARHDPTIPWARLLLPFRMGLPEVERIKNLSYGPYGRRNKLDDRRRARRGGLLRRRRTIPSTLANTRRRVIH